MNEIAQYYNLDNHSEWERLDRHRTEFAVTMRALAEFLPSPPARIIDVGGGPGRYAIALAQLGYDVTLVDLAHDSLLRAANYAEDANVRLSAIRQANALDLYAFADSSCDAVLLMGPLYHLTVEEERVKAVEEAHHLLRQNGLIFASFLTRFSALRVCAERFPQWLYENQEYAANLLMSGVHQGEWGFTTAYYADLREIPLLMNRSGFSTVEIIGCEGIVASVAEERINQLEGAAWEWWADLNYSLGKESSLHASSTHLLYVGRRE